MKGNQHKKMVFQDNFVKHWCCSAKNHPEGWHWWKKKNRKKVRRKMKDELREEINETQTETEEKEEQPVKSMSVIRREKIQRGE